VGQKLQNAKELKVVAEAKTIGTNSDPQKQGKKEKRKPGPARVYEHRFPVRANDKEYKLLTKRAKAAGYSLSRYLVETGLKAPDSPPPKELDVRQREMRERALFELRMVARNLNQIAHKMNVLNLEGNTMSASELLKIIHALDLKVDQTAKIFDED
jgi:hypothetical protein